jgi:2-oxoisovalerate dehydrogenase E1 component
MAGELHLRVPIGAYGSGGPYHSSSVESVLCNIKGIKIAYPSTGADLKGLMKAAYHDPNPVVMLEHKGLYWSKIKGTEDAKSIEPSPDYIIPFGKARMVQQADASDIGQGRSSGDRHLRHGRVLGQGRREGLPGPGHHHRPAHAGAVG